MTEKNIEQQAFNKADMLLRYLKDECAEQEKDEILDWLSADENNRLLLEEMRDEQKLSEELRFFSAVDSEKGWENVAGLTVNQPRTITMWRTLLKYAAVLALLVVSIFAVLEFKKHFEQETETESFARRYRNDISPGTNKAKLELADGSEITLEDTKNGRLSSVKEAVVTKNNGQLVYTPEGNLGAITYNKVSTPKGGAYQLILSDGSKVWLNAGSSLRFPTAFAGKERNVELIGEAYFEIAKNLKMPFKVAVGGVKIEVLGTHFNVMAYEDEHSVNTTLLEGSVMITRNGTSKVLKPGQQGRVTDRITVEEVDIEDAVAWKNGFFQFNNNEVRTIMKQLERWYNVDVQYKDQSVTALHYSGIISRNTNISNVLKMLELTGGIRFEIDGRKITVANK